MVINTMGWVEGLGFQLLMHAIKAIHADIVLVVGQDRLFQQLQASFQVRLSWNKCESIATENFHVCIGWFQRSIIALTSTVMIRVASACFCTVLPLSFCCLGTVFMSKFCIMQGSQSTHQTEFVKVSKSGGVVTRQPPYRKSARISRVKEYFYGFKDDLQPPSVTMSMEQLQVYKVGGGPKAPLSALPIGATAVADPLRIAPITNCSGLLRCLLAVSHAETPEQLLSSNVAGFLYVTDIDVKQNTITYLAPSPGPLPGKYLMTGSFQVYFE